MPPNDSRSLRNSSSLFALLASKGIKLDDSGEQRGLEIPESLKYSVCHWAIPNPQEALLGFHIHQDGIPKEVRIFPQLTAPGFKYRTLQGARDCLKYFPCIRFLIPATIL